MSELDALIARARAPGTFEGRREFTLSRERAIEKQREFTLRDRHQYALELVQAAVLFGARFIAVDTEDDAFTLAWVGAPVLTESTLENLFDQLFADRADPALRPLVQLAIGVNGLLQRRPRTLRIESGDASGVVRMEVGAGGQATVGSSRAELHGTYVRAEWSAPWLRLLRRDRGGPVRSLIEERCGYCPVPLMLNHRAPFGYNRGTLPLNAWPEPRALVRQPDREAILCLPPDPDRKPGFHVVLGGVWVTSMALPELGQARVRRQSGEWVLQGLSGVLYDDTLRKTADQSEIVRDGRFRAMARALTPAARALVERQGLSWVAPPPDVLPPLDAETAPPLAPLPLALPLANQRYGLPLSGLPPGLPLLRVAPGDQARLAAELDPAVFPLPVLALDDAQHRSLEQALPGRAVRRLASSGDVATVLAALPKARVEQRVVPLPEGGALHLRAHLSGPTPWWGEDDGTPCAVVQAGRTRWCGRVQPCLEGVSALLAETHGAEVARPEAALQRLLYRHAWRLAQALADEDARPMATALASSFGLIHRGQDGVERSLPTAWPREVSARILRLADPPPAESDGVDFTPAELAALIDGDAGWAARAQLSVDGVEVFAGLPRAPRDGAGVIVESGGRREHLAFPDAPPLVALLRADAPLSGARARELVGLASVALAQRRDRRDATANPMRVGDSERRAPGVESPEVALVERLHWALADRAPIDRVVVLFFHEPWPQRAFSSGCPGAVLLGPTLRTLEIHIPSHTALARRAMEGDAFALDALAADTLRVCMLALRRRGHDLDLGGARLALLTRRVASGG